MQESEPERYDLVVIGGGPAGVSGAIAAGGLGKRVALIEKEAVVGGAGINTGTVPSKTLRETALVLSGGRTRRLYGVDLSLRREATIADFMCHEQHVKAQERQRAEGQLVHRGVTTIRGQASFTDPTASASSMGMAIRVPFTATRFLSRPGLLRCDHPNSILRMTAFMTPTRFSN